MLNYSLRDGNSIQAYEAEQVKNIWSACFGDSKEYLDKFFEVFLKNVLVALGSDDDEIVSMLFAIPLKSNKHNPYYFHYSGGVTPNRRGRQIFRNTFNTLLSGTTGAPRNGYPAPYLKEWYRKSNIYPYDYHCREIVLTANSVLSEDLTYEIIKHDGDVEHIVAMRTAYVSSLSYEYMIYPDWFMHLLKFEKNISDGVFDIISYEGSDFYIIGRYEDEDLIIEETNIPDSLIFSMSASLLSAYDTKNIIIKLPLSDKESNKESSIVYDGQGSTSGELWSPFKLL